MHHIVAAAIHDLLAVLGSVTAKGKPVLADSLQLLGGIKLQIAVRIIPGYQCGIGAVIPNIGLDDRRFDRMHGFALRCKKSMDRNG
jgi:hypothetical protein